MTAGRMESNQTWQSLKPALFLTTENAQTKNDSLKEVMDFQHYIIYWMFLHYLWKEIPRAKNVFQNFESGLHNFGNIGPVIKQSTA